MSPGLSAFSIVHDAPPRKPVKQVAFAIGNGLPSVALCVDGEVMPRCAEIPAAVFAVCQTRVGQLLSAGLHPVCMLIIKFNVRKKFLPVVSFFLSPTNSPVL